MTLREYLIQYLTKAMTKENSKRLILIQSLNSIYDEYVREEEDQIIKFSPTFDESDGKEEEEDHFF